MNEDINWVVSLDRDSWRRLRMNDFSMLWHSFLGQRRAQKWLFGLEGILHFWGPSRMVTVSFPVTSPKIGYAATNWKGFVVVAWILQLFSGAAWLPYLPFWGCFFASSTSWSSSSPIASSSSSCTPVMLLPRSRPSPYHHHTIVVIVIIIRAILMTNHNITTNHSKKNNIPILTIMFIIIRLMFPLFIVWLSSISTTRHSCCTCVQGTCDGSIRAGTLISPLKLLKSPAPLINAIDLYICCMTSHSGIAWWIGDRYW